MEWPTSTPSWCGADTPFGEPRACSEPVEGASSIRESVQNQRSFMEPCPSRVRITNQRPCAPEVTNVRQVPHPLKPAPQDNPRVSLVGAFLRRFRSRQRLELRRDSQPDSRIRFRRHGTPAAKCRRRTNSPQRLQSDPPALYGQVAE